MKLVIEGILFILYGFTFSYSFSLLENSGDLAVNKSPQESNSDTTPEEEYFEHLVDHFDDFDMVPTWDQKYWVEKKYYEKGGPVYLILADRADLDKKTMRSGYWYKHGKEKKALFLYITHRFYDTYSSIQEMYTLPPTDFMIKFLTLQQALADYVEFIKFINQERKLPDGTKWVIFGSSYAGSLAAWLRTLFPSLVHAAVASSAPVLAKMEIPEYLDNVGNILGEYSAKCKNDIALANKDLDKMMQSPNGRKQIGEIFKLCEPLNGDPSNKSFFATNTVKYISDAVQYDLGSAKVMKICDKMLENVCTKKPIQRYSVVIHMLMDEQKQKCIKTNYTTHVKVLQVENKDDALASGRMWLYQQCQEIGWFPISRPKSSIFSKNVNLNYFINLCSKVFKKSYSKKSISKAVNITNISFKGLTLNTTRTLFVHGDADPWKFAQITSNKDNTNLDIVTIKKGSHCSDIHYGNTDKKEVVNAIKEIEKKLDSYLKN